MPSIEVRLSIGFPGAVHEEKIDIDPEDWEACRSDEDREELINTYATEWSWNYIELSFDLVDVEQNDE